MRIISGRFKGIPIPPAFKGTRPTTDRTKEAIFSSLDAWSLLEDANVLDLFAGTGALGFEALSRGSKSLVSVESSRAAANLLTRTLKQIKASASWTQQDSAQVLPIKVEHYLKSLPQIKSGQTNPSLGTNKERFDLVFIDPPYAVSSEDCDRILSALVTRAFVSEEAVMILERSMRSQPPNPPQGWLLSQAKTYGETAVYYLEAE